MASLKIAAVVCMMLIANHLVLSDALIFQDLARQMALNNALHIVRHYPDLLVEAIQRQQMIFQQQQQLLQQQQQSTNNQPLPPTGLRPTTLSVNGAAQQPKEQQTTNSRLPPADKPAVDGHDDQRAAADQR
jgi:hypothetical protein